MKKLIVILSIVVVIISQGCSSKYSHLNKQLDGDIIKPKAILSDLKDKGSCQSKVLFILSLSGGGSRAANWSAAIMFGLQNVFLDEDINLLKEVDVISAVSGGALPAAYYAISKDPEDESKSVVSNRVWQYDKVMNLMGKNYILKWFGNWFRPNNIVKYWFTSFDRSDIMAQTLTDNLFDVDTFGIEWDLKFKDINDDRPYLVLNATNGTVGSFGEQFTFTHDDFIKIGSNINEYYIGSAVMATASYPGTFNYMTLKNYSKQEDRYIHVFDGGNYDNLGLESAIRIIDNNKARYDKIIVILVDAYAKNKGVESKEPDARKFFDYYIDSNFTESFASLLTNNRDSTIKKFKKVLNSYKEKETFFYHVEFQNSQYQEKLDSIKTNFKIKKKDQLIIEKAAKELMTKNNKNLNRIKEMVTQKNCEN